MPRLPVKVGEKREGHLIPLNQDHALPISPGGLLVVFTLLGDHSKFKIDEITPSGVITQIKVKMEAYTCSLVFVQTFNFTLCELGLFLSAA